MLALGIILMCFGVICTVVFFLHFMDFIGISVMEKLFPLQSFDSTLIIVGVAFAIIGCVLIVASLLWKKHE